MELWRYNHPIKQLGERYTLLRPLGSGGMADVCLAWDERDHHEAAIKIIKPEMLAPALLQRFLHEGEVVTSLDHPYIIRVYGERIQEEILANPDPGGTDECKVPYIVMEYVKGGDLKQRLVPGQACSLGKSVRIFGQLCAAVQYAHDQGVIHRDIKPANILFRQHPQKGDQVVLSDFGLALTANYTHISLPFAGTPVYMAMEQWRGMPEFASDIFSLGVVLYELCTGCLPSRSPEKPTMHNPSLPPMLEDAILRALSDEPSQRFASASLFWQAVQRAVRDIPLSPIASPLVVQASVATPSVVQALAVPPTISQALIPLSSVATTPIEPRRTFINRNKRAIIIVALIIIMFLGLGSWVVLAQTSPATITITPASETMQQISIIQGVSRNADPDNYQVIVSQLTSTQRVTDTVTATGSVQTWEGVSATGTLTFTSTYAKDWRLIGGTVFHTTKGIDVITNEAVIIPAGNDNTPGLASVKAHASIKGTTGNIAAGTVTPPHCCISGSTAILVGNDTFSGGVDPKSYHFLQASDITPVTNAHQDRLKSDAQKAIKAQMKSGEQLLDDIHCDDTKTTEDVLPGDHGPSNDVTSAKVTVSVSCNAQVYDAASVQTIAQNALKQKVSTDPKLKGYVPIGNIAVQSQPPQPQQDGTITFSVTAKGIWYYNWNDPNNKQALLNRIKGKSIKDAQTALNSNPGIDNKTGHPKIDISNGGTTLPTDVNEIKLDVKPVKGL